MIATNPVSPANEYDDVLNAFTRAYIEAAMFSSTDESNDSGGNPLESSYVVENIAPETLERIKRDCAQFQEAHGHLFTEENCKYTGCSPEEYAGHDFWLTRNGHGAGFWDGDWEEPAASVLDDAAKAFGEFDLYIGDDGLIYGFPPRLPAPAPTP